MGRYLSRYHSGQTSLHIAVSTLNTKCVELLIIKGVDVNCQETKSGKSALHLAVDKQSKEIVDLLLCCVSSVLFFYC